MIFNIIKPDGSVEPGEYDPAGDWKKNRILFGSIVGGDPELVAVLFNGVPATLIVNEVGAVSDSTINPKGRLQPNARATAIYWTATIKGITPVPFNPLKDPMIYGPAILIEVDKRRL